MIYGRVAVGQPRKAHSLKSKYFVFDQYLLTLMKYGVAEEVIFEKLYPDYNIINYLLVVHFIEVFVCFVKDNCVLQVNLIIVSLTSK